MSNQNFKMEDLTQMSDDNAAENEGETSSDEVENDDKLEGNPGLADALAKAIRMGKNSKIKNGKSVVLSKAKLYNPKPLPKKTHGFEVVSELNDKIKVEEDVDVKPDVEDIKINKSELKKLRVPKQERVQRGRLKPSPLDRQKERPLVKIATRGVVQLFNAVRQQQSAINKQINKPGITEGKKEKILKSIDKKAFLDVLMGKGRNESDSKSNVDVSNVSETEVKSEPEDEEPSWKVLRDDFMMGAKLKDWDKKEIEVMDE